MNIQIFGTKKCNETKKAERFFKEHDPKAFLLVSNTSEIIGKGFHSV